MNQGCAAYNTAKQLRDSFDGKDTIRNVRLGLASVTSKSGAVVCKIGEDKIQMFNDRQLENRPVYFKPECVDVLLSSSLGIAAVYGSLSQCGAVRNLRAQSVMDRDHETQILVGDLVLGGKMLRNLLSLIIEGDDNQCIYFSPKYYTEQNKKDHHKVISIVAFNACSKVL